MYTRRRRPVRVVWAVQHDSVEQAFAYEKQIQGWSRRKRAALIRGDFEQLPKLAGRRTSSTDRWFRDGRQRAFLNHRTRWLRRLRSNRLETTSCREVVSGVRP